MSDEETKQEVTLDTLAAMIKVGFDDVHARIDGVETALTEKIETEIANVRDDMQAGFASVHRRVDFLAERIEDHETRIAKIEHELTP